MPPKSTPKTRTKSGEVGPPSALPETGALPVNKDIIAAIDHEITKGLSVNEALVEVKGQIINKFKNVNPSLNLSKEDVIRVKMKWLYDKAVKLRRKQLVGNAATIFKERLNKLFDIITCQCEIVNCGGGKACRSEKECTGFHALCSCPPADKIPEKEIRFVKDQREKIGLCGGEMMMEGVDSK